MIASKLARTTLVGLKFPKTSNFQSLIFRNFQSQKENVVRRSLRSKVVQEAVSGSTEASATPITLGRGLVAGASLFGLGALAYYGMGLSNQSGFLDRASLWPQYVRERVQSTYSYFGTGLGITAGAAYAVTRSPALMKLAMGNSMLAMFGSLALVIGSGMVARSIPYNPNTILSPKTAAWALHAGIIGGVIAPLALLGGPLLIRAAWMTAGIVGGLSAIAATAPSDKFLNMGGPLAIGLGVVFASSIAGAFIPPTGKLGLSLYSVSIYGGLVLFAMLMLYDTQRIVNKAENHSHFDPVSESISIYLDTINIFIRIATILATGGSRRK